MRICIDPGHGGRDPGAVGPSGLKEADVALAVGARLAKLLVAMGCEIKMTRTADVALGSDVNSDLAARVAIAEQFKADFYLSIHCNSGSSSAAGMEAYTTPGQGPSDKIAEAIYTSWAQAFPQMKLRKDLTDGDSDKEANFYVIRKTSMPAVLVELAFISNPAEEKMLADPVFQERTAQTLAQGIMSGLGMKVQPAAIVPDAVMINARGQQIVGRLIDGKTWAPIGDVLRALSISFQWDGARKIVNIQ